MLNAEFPIYSSDKSNLPIPSYLLYEADGYKIEPTLTLSQNLYLLKERRYGILSKLEDGLQSIMGFLFLVAIFGLMGIIGHNFFDFFENFNPTGNNIIDKILIIILAIIFSALFLLSPYLITGIFQFFVSIIYHVLKDQRTEALEKELTQVMSTYPEYGIINLREKIYRILCDYKRKLEKETKENAELGSQIIENSFTEFKQNSDVKAAIEDLELKIEVLKLKICFLENSIKLLNAIVINYEVVRNRNKPVDTKIELFSNEVSQIIDIVNHISNTEQKFKVENFLNELELIKRKIAA
jgi:hypothetical protein